MRRGALHQEGGWHDTRANAQIASSYPDDSSSLLASAYEQGADKLKGAANIVTFKVGDGEAAIAGTDLNFRAWTKVDWLVIANMIYQGPSTPVSASEMAWTRTAGDRS